MKIDNYDKLKNYHTYAIAILDKAKEFDERIELELDMIQMYCIGFPGIAEKEYRNINRYKGAVERLRDLYIKHMTHDNS